jgi:hypothetical protein
VAKNARHGQPACDPLAKNENLANLAEFAIVTDQSVATFLDGCGQLNRIRQLQAVAQAKSRGEYGDITVNGAKIPARRGGQGMPIALHQGFLAGLQRSRRDLREGDRGDYRSDPASLDVGEERLEPGGEGVPFKDIDDWVGVEENRCVVRDAGC